MSPQLGTFGAWFNPSYDDDTRRALRGRGGGASVRYRVAGPGAADRPISGSSSAHLTPPPSRVATAIVNMWTNDAASIAAYERIEAQHRGRFLLGVGIGHPESINRYSHPTTRWSPTWTRSTAAYPRRRVLAALGDRALRLAGTARRVPPFSSSRTTPITPATSSAPAPCSRPSTRSSSVPTLATPAPSAATSSPTHTLACATTSTTCSATASAPPTSPTAAATASSTPSSSTAPRRPSPPASPPTWKQAPTTSAYRCWSTRATTHARAIVNWPRPFPSHAAPPTAERGVSAE